MATRILLIQLQPHLVPTMDEAKARAALAAFAEQALVIGHRVTEGNENGAFINFEYKTNDLAALWHECKERIYQNSLLAFQLQRATMAIAQGDDGWEDCLLLHHFDPATEVDEFLE
ncbi:hypothetical protein K4H28_11455 [Deefgea tanakiae]|uniref:ABM domain-containing protein n=1 Tax=Deefgea tanakiae TaxID=2865840 RepID=A0ABX8Z790_9NEIS|nr:hypothetical protein [Deefgea tanakiae]QZA76928.1 hypothetical protein K4H28_11455 [Deefgea tanakiae]